jgi:uncharacterized protein YndB with AHSA1/START domain
MPADSAATGTIVISCSPAEAFRYSSDPGHRAEWQASVGSLAVETPGPLGVGTRVRERRRVLGWPHELVWEFTHYQPGARWSLRGLEGSLRPRATMTFTELDQGAATRVSLALEYEGSGLGALSAALAQRGAPREVRSDLSSLRRRLEADGGR